MNSTPTEENSHGLIFSSPKEQTVKVWLPVNLDELHCSKFNSNYAFRYRSGINVKRFMQSLIMLSNSDIQNIIVKSEYLLSQPKLLKVVADFLSPKTICIESDFCFLETPDEQDAFIEMIDETPNIEIANLEISHVLEGNVMDYITDEFFNQLPCMLNLVYSVDQDDLTKRKFSELVLSLIDRFQYTLINTEYDIVIKIDCVESMPDKSYVKMIYNLLRTQLSDTITSIYEYTEGTDKHIFELTGIAVEEELIIRLVVEYINTPTTNYSKFISVIELLPNGKFVSGDWLDPLPRTAYDQLTLSTTISSLDDLIIPKVYSKKTNERTVLPLKATSNKELERLKNLENTKLSDVEQNLKNAFLQKMSGNSSAPTIESAAKLDPKRNESQKNIFPTFSFNSNSNIVKYTPKEITLPNISK